MEKKAPITIAIDIREAGQEKTGKGWYTYHLVHELLKLDHHNHYELYTDSAKNPFATQNEANAPTKQTGAAPKNVTLKHIPAKGLKWHLNALKELKAHPPDLFFAPTSYIIPSLAPKTLKVVITVHDLVAFLYPQNHNLKAVVIERLTLKKAVKKAASIFVVSQNTQKDLLERFRYPVEQIQTVSCAPSDFYKEPVSAHELAQFQEKFQLPQNFILAVGTLEPRKNFSNLIKSFVIIKRKCPDYKLVIVGKKGWKYKQIEDTLKKYQLEKEVIFPGYLSDEDLKKVYTLATVFVFPSLYEGFGIPPLEAMSCGCPVVSSNVASLPEVIGDAGILVDPKNAHKMADSVVTLIENDQIRSMLIERGKRRAEKFNWHESAKTALEAFEKLVR